MEEKTLLTTGLSARLNDVAENGYVAMSKDRWEEGDTRSVLEVALSNGMTLKQYATTFPESAVTMAEASLAQWLRVQGAVALTGTVDTSAGTVVASPQQTRLISERVKEAREQLSEVREYALLAVRSGEQVKDRLVRIVLDKAAQGDKWALTTILNRNDGLPTIARPASDLDEGYKYAVYCVIQTLFKKQLEVLNAGNGTFLLCCSRRAGKTQLLVALCLIECLRRPNTICIYIGETMQLTDQLVDEKMNQLVDSCNLRDKKGKRLNWRKLDNGSQILVRGLSNTKDPDQIRGHAAKVIVIDEFFHLKSELLSYLQQQVLEPMQLDYADDYKFICAGTPPAVKGTFGEYAWKTWDVPKFFWTWRDNPHPTSMEARKEYIDKKLKEKGLDWDSSYARREYNGEWAYDEDLLLYPEVHTYDPHLGLPQIHVTRVLFGLDYGVSDNDALVGIAWSDDEKRGYVFHEDKFNRLDIKDRTVSQLEYLKQQVKYAWQNALDYFPGMSAREANKRILWDADDNNQHVTDELNISVRLEGQDDIRLNIQNAHKTDKVMMFDKIRDLLRRGDLLLPEHGKVEDECISTILLRGNNNEVYPEVDDAAYHPDLLPAMRYALYNVIGV